MPVPGGRRPPRPQDPVPHSGFGTFVRFCNLARSASIDAACCKPMIRHVTDSDIERVRAFLESHVDTSLFLLSTLAALGPRLGSHLNSGNFRVIQEGGQIAAVFCLTRRGNLLVQAGGRVDLAEQIFEDCETEPMEVRGIVGEWPAAEALWKLLCADPRFEPTHALKDVLYRLMLKETTRPAGEALNGSVTVRALDPEDFVQWERLNSAYFAELSLPLQATLEQRRTDFIVRIRSGLWWGAFDDCYDLVSIAALNATYGSLGQVGGVYTRPADRKKGLAKAVMRLLIEDCRKRLRFEKLVLFTGEDNTAARRLYESLDFQAAGAFGLLLGDRRANIRAPERHKWAGQSGEMYTYEVFDWPARLTPGPGNYIFATSNAAGDWHPLLVGECADLSTLTVQDRLRSGAGRHPATHVHVRLNFNPVSVRRREVSDLAEHWTPPDQDVLV
ncbi:MAG: acetyltransferase [Gammaproteobacteria bacterium]|nr:acetyltransferase [Gammaproteobacteria bacterium]